MKLVYHTLRLGATAERGCEILEASPGAGAEAMRVGQIVVVWRDGG